MLALHACNAISTCILGQIVSQRLQVQLLMIATYKLFVAPMLTHMFQVVCSLEALSTEHTIDKHMYSMSLAETDTCKPTKLIGKKLQKHNKLPHLFCTAWTRPCLSYMPNPPLLHPSYFGHFCHCLSYIFHFCYMPF